MTGLHYIGDGKWGMPGSLTTVSTVIGLFLAHKINIPAGISLPILVGASKIALGGS